MAKSELVHYKGFEDFIYGMAAERPHAIMLLCERDGKLCRVTWKDFADDVTARVAELRESDKTCVAIMSDGSYDCVREIFAANIAGLQIAMLDAGVPDAMLGQLLPYVDADMLWSSNEKRKEALAGALVGTKVDGKGRMLFFTSGTTSRQKAVVLTDPSLMSAAFYGSSTLPVGSGDVLLCVLPLGHVFGFVCGLLWPLLSGATVALGRGGRHVFDDWTFFRPTVTSVVPILLEHLLRRDLINPELNTILVGAGDCSPERLAEAKERGIRVSFGYGLTETSSGVAISMGDDPFAMTVCDGCTITLADDGEVLIQSPGSRMQGYYKLPADTAEVLIDGVLHTGDLGSFDADGNLHIQGRKKEVLVMPGGTKIFLPEYERQISEELGTSEVAVVLRKGMPVLVLDDLKDSATEAVLSRVKGAMEGWDRSQQLADVVELGRELPRTASGKIQHWMIQAELDQRWAALKDRARKVAGLDDDEPEAKAEEAVAEAEAEPIAEAEAVADAPEPIAEAEAATEETTEE
ncbi:MAG: long-chain fatty acid--CoA ligase [Atopobiaceae bacterium]|nr:long-chain fatty acid--CoA ligase [Atopobiaceae bacterium]